MNPNFKEVDIAYYEAIIENHKAKIKYSQNAIKKAQMHIRRLKE